MKPTHLLLALCLLLAFTQCKPKKDNAAAAPELTDEQLMDTIERLTFNYFWDGAEPHSGLARERIHLDGDYPQDDQNVVTPEESLRMMRHLYQMGDSVLGPYGFYDAFSETDGWYPKRYLAIDQGPIAVMIENHRSGLLWRLFMSHPDVQAGLKKLGFAVKEEQEG